MTQSLPFLSSFIRQRISLLVYSLQIGAADLTIAVQFPGTGNVFYIVRHSQSGTVTHPERHSHESYQALLSKSEIKIYRLSAPPTSPHPHDLMLN
jgi:hypothetical protein